MFLSLSFFRCEEILEDSRIFRFERLYNRHFRDLFNVCTGPRPLTVLLSRKRKNSFAHNFGCRGHPRVLYPGGTRSCRKNCKRIFGERKVQGPACGFRQIFFSAALDHFVFERRAPFPLNRPYNKDGFYMRTGLTNLFLFFKIRSVQ